MPRSISRAPHSDAFGSDALIRPASRVDVRRRWRGFALSCAALLLTACGGDKAPAGAAGGQPGGDRPTPVTTIRLQPETFAERISAIGTVKARESVTVTAKVSELVQQVHFDSGDEVRAGAPLITLSDQQQRAALNEAQATADEADRLFRRQSELAQQQLIARSQLDTQRATRDSANARVGQIRAQLADRVIRAPFSGVLGLRQVSPGALVTPGTPIATLDELARVYVDFPLPESQLSLASQGRAITGTAAAYPDRTFDGVVAIVDARVDPGTRAVTVRADLPNPERLLRPGMLVNVTLPSAERQALMVPEIAVVQVGRDSFVYRAKDDGSVEQVRLTLGARGDGKVEIVDGAKAGDRIVVDGTGKLRPGAKISEGAATPKQETMPATPPSATPSATPASAESPPAAPPPSTEPAPAGNPLEKSRPEKNPPAQDSPAAPARS